MDDWELLQAYVQHGSESAFQRLVERYVDQVHSMALRQVGDAHRAQDVTQAVFLILVRKAGSLPRRTVLAGWLFKATQHVAQTALRSERRRKQREMQALADSVMEPDTASASQVEAQLDDALASLDESDRNALLLRYFQQRSVPDVAASLGTSQEAAQKRIERAMEKLRRYFGRRGVAVPAVTLLGGVFAQAVQPAPPLLVQGIVALGVPSTPAVSAAAVGLMQGALQTMGLAKLLAPVTLGAAALLMVVAVVGFLAMSGPDTPVVYDLARDFSQASNPNGVWSYGWQGTLGGAFNLLPVRGTVRTDNGVPIDYWQAVPLNEPTVYHNGSTNTASSNRGRGVHPPGAVWFSAGPTGSGRNFGVVRFTAPSTATYQVILTAKPYMQGPRQGDADLHVLQYGVESFAQNLAAGETAAHTNTVKLSAGDTIDFAIGRGADDSNFASALQITIRITVSTPTVSSVRANVQRAIPFSWVGGALAVAPESCRPTQGCGFGLQHKAHIGSSS